MRRVAANADRGEAQGLFDGLLRLTTVRYRSDSVAICGAVRLDVDGEVYPSHEHYSVRFPRLAQSADPREGQTWHVGGVVTTKCFDRGQCQITEIQIIARTAELRRPSGDHIVQLLVRSDDFPGVGEVTARRLWNAFGEDIYRALDEGDEAALCSVIGARLATVVLDGWKVFAASDALAWLHRTGIEPRISRDLLETYGPEVKAKVEDDPYRTLAFGMSWSAADHLAITTFGLLPDDSRRLCAAVESRLFAALEEGHTALPKSVLLGQLETVVGPMAQEALASAVACGVAIEVGSDLLVSAGMEVVERRIAGFVRESMHEEPLCSTAVVASVVRHYEMETTASIGEPFGLNDAQRRAVEAVAEHGALLITGGAGVGKTTVLRAVVALLDHVASKYRLMTISGRAARRVAQATGQAASTIAGYLRAAEADRFDDEGRSPIVAIVDEASMLDVLLAWRIIESLPKGSRIILIGDPAQLPPVGPGLTLHALVRTPIHNVLLTEERRFGGEIAAFSREIRHGNLPTLPDSAERPVSLIELPAQAVVAQLVDLYLQDPEDTQILAFVRKGTVSCEAINRAVQRRLVGASHTLSADESRVGLKVENEDGLLEYTGLRRLDKVICNVNLHNEGLQNGSLGQIVEVFVRPVKRSALKALKPGQADEDTFAVVLWDDGEERPVTLAVLDAMELAYCITTHKSQGSQFNRVLVACTRSSLLDRAIIYTAVTRAARQVLLVGDIQATREAVAKSPLAAKRITTLASRLLGGVQT